MVVVYTCTVEHECTVGQTCTVKQPLLNYVQWNNGVEFPITSNYKFRSGAKGSALVYIIYYELEYSTVVYLFGVQHYKNTEFHSSAVYLIVGTIDLHQ